MRGHVPGMTNQHPRRNFTPSDDALIRQQPVTGISLKLLATLLRTNREALMYRADELGVSLPSAMIQIMAKRSTMDSSIHYWNG
jgi:hypothetical protein